MRSGLRRPLIRSAVCALTATILWSAQCSRVSNGAYDVEVYEEDHAANYERIFEHAPPQNVEIIHSVVFEYSERPFSNSSPDWEIELLASKSWIETTVNDFPLSGPHSRASEDEDVAWRRQNRARNWYAPKALQAYDTYKMTLTSIPYVHLLAERDPQPDGRFRVFVSKH